MSRSDAQNAQRRKSAAFISVGLLRIPFQMQAKELTSSDCPQTEREIRAR